MSMQQHAQMLAMLRRHALDHREHDTLQYGIRDDAGTNGFVLQHAEQQIEDAVNAVG